MWTRRSFFRRLLLLTTGVSGLLFLPHCTTGNAEERAKSLTELRRLYTESLQSEQEAAQPHYLWRDTNLIIGGRKRQAADFWMLYASERRNSGRGVMLRELRRLIAEHGVSVLLFIPVDGDIRGPKEDDLVNEMIINDTPTSPLADRLLAHVPQFEERLRVAAYGRKIGGGQ